MTDTVTTQPQIPTPTGDAGIPARNTEVRGHIKDTVRFALWGKSAGRCVLCNQRLLAEGQTFLHSINAAEVAHIRGATATPGSPRGIVEGESNELDREAEENLLLLCHTCHKVIDDKAHVEFFTAPKLRELKARHELRVERATEEGGLTRTAVLRVGAIVRDSFAIASRREVANTLISHNYLGLVDSQRSGQFTCELAGKATDEEYWLAARTAIRRTLSTIQQAVADEEVAHISVFAIAPIPALVLLGAELDDKVDTRLWQKDRDAGWAYPSKGDPVDFTIESIDSAGQACAATDVVLICSLSAEVNIDRLPVELENVPVLTIRPDGIEATPSVLEHEDTLPAFRRAFRRMLATAEKKHPNATRWHLVGAMPVAAAIESGRAFMRDAQPPVDVYQRTEHDTYEAVLTINQTGRDTSALTIGSRP